MFTPASPIASADCPGQRRERAGNVMVEPHSSRLNAPVPHYGGLAPWQLIQVKRFIENRLLENIRIKTLADFVGLSESYFYSAFRRSTGQTPHGFVTQRRIQQAQALMIHTDLPLSRIAYECGLTDQPHLTRLFHRQVGASPAVWRKRHRETSKTFATLGISLPASE